MVEEADIIGALKMGNSMQSKVPTFEKYMNPILEGLYKIGGSGSKKETYEVVAKIMKLPEEVLSVPHGDGGQTKVQYRIAWALTYLKKIGLIDNSTRGVWSLINPGKLSVVDAQETKTIVRKQLKCGKMPLDEKGGNGTIEEDTVEENWQSTALKTIQAIPPDAFERLCQRLLRESGFIEVIV